MSKELVCAECGRKLGGVSVFEFEGNTYCEDCFEELTVVCDCCERRIWRDNAEGDSLTLLCEHCYSYSYTHCERCGCLIHNDSALYENDSDYSYCQECYEKIMSEPIKSYYYKPEPIFYGNGSRFYGVELEIDQGGEVSSNAQKLLDYVNQDNTYIYAKHDGSLSNGFEIVSHPMTIEHHLNEVDYSGLFKMAVGMRYRSHQAGTCGLHIHVNRTAFGDSREKQEEVIARIVFFVEKHWCELVKFSRRKIDNLNRWAAKFASISDTTAETYKKAKERHLGRYVAVNLENYNTVEIRLFRGTLRYQTFVATLQLVDEICHVCTYLNDKELEGLSWSSFVMGIYDKPELIEYLKSKRLYVNEQPIEEMEEM